MPTVYYNVHSFLLTLKTRVESTHYEDGPIGAEVVVFRRMPWDPGHNGFRGQRYHSHLCPRVFPNFLLDGYAIMAIHECALRDSRQNVQKLQ